ncbi:MAG: hypothetical protein JJE13_04270 [Thermoleophilia bacterium]|nr:hypothetical protein [Thermoleophilia bacterium]
MDSIEQIGTSSRETDRLAFLIYKALRDLPSSDKQLVLNSLKSTPEVNPARAALIRTAVERFEVERGGRLSKRRYERWRVETGDKSLPSATFISTTYGRTWSKAMDALGRQPSLEHSAFRLRALGKAPDSDEVLADLARCAADLDTNTLRFADYHNWAKQKQPHAPVGKVYLMSAGSFINRFQSFRRALVLAGLKPNSLGRWGNAEHYTDDSAIRSLRVATEEVAPSGAITMAQYNRWRQGKYSRANETGEWLAIPSFHTIRYRLGTWPEALAAAGLVSEATAAGFSRGAGAKMPPSQIADGLLRASENLGARFTFKAYVQWRTAEARDMSKVRPASVSIVRRAFGGWISAMDALCKGRASLDPQGYLVDVILERGAKHDK